MQPQNALGILPNLDKHLVFGNAQCIDQCQCIGMLIVNDNCVGARLHSGLQLIRIKAGFAIVGAGSEQSDQWLALGIHRTRNDAIATTSSYRHHCAYFNLSRSKALTWPGLALPCDCFITWPTKKPSTFSLPARNCSTCSGLAAMTSSIRDSMAPLSVI